jgi:hypothetical protein
MRFEVSEDALSAGAAAVERAAALVASLALDDVATSVAQAMPGSRSAGGVREVAGLLDHLIADLARDLAGHADALRLAGVEYVEIDRDVAAAGTRAHRANHAPWSTSPTPERGAA